MGIFDEELLKLFRCSCNKSQTLLHLPLILMTANCTNVDFNGKLILKSSSLSNWIEYA